MVKWWFDKAWVCGTSLCILQGPYRLWTHYGPGMWPLVLPSKKDFYKCDRFSHCFQGSLLVNQWTCCWIDLKLWVPGRSNLVRLKVDPIHVMSWFFLSLTVCWMSSCRHETSTCWTIPEFVRHDLSVGGQSKYGLVEWLEHSAEFIITDPQFPTCSMTSWYKPSIAAFSVEL